MKKIIFFLVIIISLFIINNLVRSIWDLWQKQTLISNAQKQLEGQKAENKRLKDKLSEVSRPEFIEEEARNKLFMAKPGELQVLISKDLLQASESGKEKPDQSPNWRKWWNLFF